MGLFNPANFKVGGKLVNDVTANLTFAAALFDYNGSQPVPVPAIHMHGVVTGTDNPEFPAGTEFNEYYKVGKATEFRINDAKNYFVPLVEGAGISDNCKAATLLTALGNLGLDIDTEDLSTFDGNYRLVRKKETREFKNKAAGTKESKDNTILLPTVRNESTATAVSGKPNGKAANGVDAQAKKYVDDILAANGIVQQAHLGKLVFDKAKSEKNVQAIVKAAISEQFIKANYALDGGVISARA